MTEYVQVKDFDRFQHYKDRDPPWIKLYVRILDDYAFSQLPDAQKAHLILIWVLASRLENKIPKDANYIRTRIGASSTVDLDALLASGFLQDWEEGTARGKREDWPTRYIPKEVRADVLSAGRCAECGARSHLEVDHIVPVSKGGTGDRANLQALCRKCNRIKRSRIPETVAPQTLRRETDLRTTEAETEAETQERTTTSAGAAESADRRELPHSQGSCMRLVVERLYFGRRPSERDMATNGSILRNLASAHGYDRMARIIEGLAQRRDKGELYGVGAKEAVSLKWLNSNKMTLNQLAVSEDALYQGGAPKRKGKGGMAGMESLTDSVIANIGRGA